MDFSFKRLWTFFSSDTADNIVVVRSLYAMSVLFVVIISLLFNFLSGQGLNHDTLMTLLTMFMCFMVLLSYNMGFYDVEQKKKWLRLEQKPATMFEKYISRIVHFVVVIPVFQKVFFVAVEWLRVLFLPRFEGDWFMSIYGRADGQPFREYLFGDSFSMAGFLAMTLIVTSICICFATRYGAAKGFLRTILAGLVAMFLFIAVFVIVTDNILSMSEIEEANNVTIEGTNFLMSIYLGLGLVMMYLIPCFEMIINAVFRRCATWKRSLYKALSCVVLLLLTFMQSVTFWQKILEEGGELSFGAIHYIVVIVLSLITLYGSYYIFKNRQLIKS